MKKIPKKVWILGLVSLFNDIGSEMLYPILPIFITQVLKAPVDILGVIEGVAEGIASLFKTLFGHLSDQTQRRKPFVVYGYISSAIGKGIIAFSRIWPVVFLGRVLDRFGKGIRTGARDALLYDTSNKRNKGLIFGFHRALDSAGAFIGPSITLILLLVFKRTIFHILYIAIIPSFLALFLLTFIKESTKKTKTIEKRALFPSVKNLSPKLQMFFLIIAIFTLGNSSDAFLILRAQNIGLSLTLTVGAYILYNFVYAAASTPAGILADKIGAKRVFLYGVLLYSIVYLAFAVNSHPLVIYLLFAIYGLYIAFTDGVSKALIGEFVKPKEAGTAYGALQTVISIFTLFASVVAGIIWTKFSPSATFIFGAFCSLTAYFLFLIFA